MTFVAIPSVRHAQIIALTGLDGVIIDCEHGESPHLLPEATS
jgi:4-hydroxy-2-oxoheptanedioate aldolase